MEINHTPNYTNKQVTVETKDLATVLTFLKMNMTKSSSLEEVIFGRLHVAVHSAHERVIRQDHFLHELTTELVAAFRITQATEVLTEIVEKAK